MSTRSILFVILIFAASFAIWKIRKPTPQVEKKMKIEIKMKSEPEDQLKFVRMMKESIIRLNNLTSETEIRTAMDEFDKVLCQNFAQAQVKDWMGEILFDKKGTPQERVLVRLSPHVFLKSTQTLKQFSGIKEKNWVKVSGQFANKCPVIENENNLDTSVLFNFSNIY